MLRDVQVNLASFLILCGFPVGETCGSVCAPTCGSCYGIGHQSIQNCEGQDCCARLLAVSHARQHASLTYINEGI